MRFISRLPLLATLMLLPACGFHSVYGGHSSDGTPVAEELGQIFIDPIPDRAGQMLRNDLIDNFYRHGRPAAPLYILSVKLKVSEEDLGTLANATTALAAVHASGEYTLKDKSGKLLTSGISSSTGQYDKIASMYATQAAKDSAMERTVREVGEQLTARIGLYFAERKPETP
jgi:LPS-assembly lipoprotein